MGAVLVTLSVFDTGYSLFQIATGQEEFSARQAGLSILLSRIPGSTIARKIAAKFKAKTGRNLKIPCVKNSFVAGTLIHTQQGLISIEDVKIGDYVLSYNEQTGEQEYQEVVHLIQHENDNQLIKIEASTGESFISTPDHPFYVSGDWKDADDLSLSDQLSLSEGYSSVVGLSSLDLTTVVYNFTVANNHNYYIGEIGTLVHNDDDCVISVGNMKEFFDDLPFGNILKNLSTRTSKRFQGQTIYKAKKDAGNIKKGDHFYLDNLHKDHIEVFDKRGSFRHVIGLDGVIIPSKTAAAANRSIKDLL